MTPEAQEALNFLSTVTPINIHKKTNATIGHRLDFESLWNKHGPQAARYGILARYMDGQIKAL